MSGTDVKNAIGWTGGALPIGGASPGELAVVAQELSAETNFRRASIRDAGQITLVNVSGTGDAIMADMPTNEWAAGISVSASSTVELIAIAANTGAVTLKIGSGAVEPVRNADGQNFAAGELVAGRSYILKRRGSGWRVINELTRADLKAAALDTEQRLSRAPAAVAKQVGYRDAMASDRYHVVAASQDRMVIGVTRDGLIGTPGVEVVPLHRDAFVAPPVIEANGSVIADLHPDGSIRMDLRLRGYATDARDASQFLEAWVDPEGYVNAAVMPDGRMMVALHDDSFSWLVDPPWERSPVAALPWVANGEAWLWLEGKMPVRIATDDDLTGALSAGISGRAVYVLASGPEGIRRITMPVAPKNSLSPDVSTVWHVPITGQSNAIGWHSSPLVAAEPMDQGRAAMFEAGVRVLQNAHPPASVDDILKRDGLNSFVDLAERNDGNSKRTFASTLAHGLLPNLAADIGLHFAATGLGGTSYHQRRKGQEPFRNLGVCVERAVTIARQSGQDCIVPFYITVDGESDGTISAAVYQGYKTAERADIEAAVKLRTGQSRDVICVHDQNSFRVKDMALGQLQLALEDPDHFICIGGKYHLPYADHVHLTGNSQAVRGYEFSRALRRKLIEGVNPLPLHIVSAVRTGGSIVCTWGGDVEGPVVIDTTRVTDPGNFGLRFVQSGGNSPAIQSITQTGPMQTTVVLSEAPTGTDQKIEIARHPDSEFGGPTQGTRANFRDSSPDTCSFNGTTYPLYRWAAHWATPVTNA